MATVLQPDRRTRLTEQIDVLARRTNVRLGAAEEARRDLTPDEQAAHDREIAEITRLTTERDRLAADDDMMAMIEGLGRSDDTPIVRAPSGAALLRPPRPAQLLSIGSQFLKGTLYQELRKTTNRGNGWNSAASDELHLYAATLTEDPASGGALVTPMIRPGIVPLPLPPLNIADLFAPGTTTSNAVVYMAEKTITNAAAPVLEGGVKPETGIIFEQKTDPVRKIATWLPASEEILEDAAGLRSYLDARLSLFVRLEEEDQLLNGTGVAPELLGILARPGLAAPIARVDPATNADALAAQMFAIQAATNLPVSGFVINPVNWQSIVLSKTTDGDYLGDGPFREPNALSLWGVPVALSSRITAGTALVGAFATGGQIFRRGGVRVDATNAHADFFVKNLVAIRAEERLALAVYRPAAFGLVTGLL
jgi:HK97 family phage major capsid protein